MKDVGQTKSYIRILEGSTVLRIALVERPVGTLTVFHFLHKLQETTITDFIQSGWNRRTIEKSLKRLVKLGLVDRKQTSQFPRFEKRYSLTQSGAYIAGFVNMLKEACDKHEEVCLEDMSRYPKGCLRLLVYLSREKWKGITNLLKETGLSANQAYKCLRALDSAGILSVDRTKKLRTKVISCESTPVGNQVSIRLDAIDSALDRILQK